MKKLVYLLSAALVLGLFGNGFSQNRAVGVVPGAGRYVYAANLNLTSEQLTKLNDLRTAFYNETVDLRNQLQSKSLELRTLMLDPVKNQSKITALQKEMLTIQQKLQEKALNLRVEARKLLTPEQLAMLPPGCGLGIGIGMGFGAGRGYGLGINYAGGYGRGRGGFARGGRGAGRGMGWRSAYCPYRY